MVERLTRQQMSEKYPNQWLGIRAIKYNDTEERQIESAEVVYINKSASELGFMSLNGEDIQPLFTTPDDTFQLGFKGE